ncbi:MAG: nicotinamide mononucleotide transporter [Lachnospiraceae bacterium]|nr:nicotinamide mononucleotide transporter [Lachnospiraceae bacterium]
MKEFIKKELDGWKKLEIAWVVIATIVMLGLSIYWKDTVIGIISALTGIWCVILTGKGKISSYIFGMINTLLYAYIAYGAKYYGEVMLNLLYYVPTNVIGFVLWKKNMNQENTEVVKKRMKVKTQLLVATGTAFGVFLYGLVLKKLGGQMPLVDSMSTVLSVVAQILCVKRYMEQWIIWIVVDVVTIIMWAVVFAQGGESIATLVMWSVYLINAIIMFVKWFKETKKEVVHV